MTKYIFCRSALVLAMWFACSGCGAAPESSASLTESGAEPRGSGAPNGSDGSGVSRTKRRGDVPPLPRGYEALATYDQFSASAPRMALGFGIRHLRVDAESADAFADESALETLVGAVLRDAAEAGKQAMAPTGQATVREQSRGRTRGRPRGRGRPARGMRQFDAQVLGYHDGQLVYRGVAAAAEQWRLKTAFNAAAALAELETVPPGLEGLLALADRVQASRRTGMRSAGYERTARARARELLGAARDEFPAQLAQVDEAGGLGAVRSLESRVLAALQTIGLSRDAADFASLATAEVERRAQGELVTARQRLREQPAASLFEILNLGAAVADLHRTLAKQRADGAAQDLAELVPEEIARRLARDATATAFAAELSAIGTDTAALPQLHAMGADLQAMAASQPGLEPYIDEVATRFGELLDASLANDVASIERAGESVFDVPALRAEADELADWYLGWGAHDLAAAVREAGAARITALAATGYAAYARELEQREASRAVIQQLEQDLGFFREHGEALANAAEYTELVRSTVGRMSAQLSSGLAARLGLPSSAAGVGVSVAGHRLDLGALAENLRAAGHELVGSKVEPSGSDAPALAALTIATKDGVAVTIAGGPTAPGDPHFSGSRLQVDGNEEDLYPNEWVALMLQLGAVVPAGDVDAAGVADSDRFASDPMDPRKVVEQGTFAEELVHDVALDAALRAIEANPDEPRFYYHAGRTLLAMGELEQSRPFLERAHADGYPAAAAALGGMLVQSIMSAGEEQMPKISEMRRAKQLFDAASAGGYAVAAEQSTMVSELMAGMTPKFDQGFRKPNLLAAVYSGGIDRLLGADEATQRNYLYYFSTLRAAVAAKHRGFRDSQLNRDLEALAPEIHKDAQKVEQKLQEGGLLQGLQEYMKMSERALGNRDVWRVDRSYPQGADWDSMMLMMYLGHDADELTRVFTNVLEYLRRAR